MSWYDKYTFTLDHSTGGTRVATPTIDDFIHGWDGDDENVFYRAISETEFLFKGDDYDYLKTIDDGADRCTPVTLTVEVDCGGTDVEVFSGLIRLNDVEFAEYNCQARATPSPNDDYTDFYNFWKDEVNILSGTTKTTAQTFVGEIEVQRCPATGFDDVFEVFPSSPPQNDSCLSNPAAGWTMIRNYLKSLIPSVSGPSGTYDGVHYTYWAREKVTGASGVPPGSGWINLGGGTYVRSVPVEFDPAQYINDASGAGVIQVVYVIAGVEQEETSDVSNNYDFTAHEYDNGVLLEEVLDALLPSGWSVVSDFYSINPDGTNPSNDAYTAAQENYAGLLFFQMTDITRWNATQNATKAILTMEQLLEQLWRMDQVKWTVTGQVLRLEHISYFTKTNGFDSTQLPHAPYNIGKTTYRYEAGALPKYEKFTWIGSPVSDYFEGDPIEYTTCLDEESGTESYNNDRICTDLGIINQRGEDMGTDGFVVLATSEYEGTRYVIQGGGYLNGRMSRTYKHDKFWRHHRYQATGKINGSSVTFLSSRRTKVQESINLKLSCTDLQAYDPGDYLRSSYGWGEVVQGRYSAKNCLLTATLKHE